jgi:hypothetical protein
MMNANTKGKKICVVSSQFFKFMSDQGYLGNPDHRQYEYRNEESNAVKSNKPA